MNKKAILLIAFMFLPFTAYAETYWGGELPYIKDTSVEAEVTLDGNIYTYSYSVHSGSANSGQIWSIDIDIKQPRNTMTLSMGTADEPSSFAEFPTVPVKLFSPPNWNSDLGYLGTASWGSDRSEYRILPGQSLNDFQLKSPGLPGIREFRVEPKLAPAPMESNIAAVVEETEKNASLIAKTIGPTAPPRALSAMFETIGGYITESLNLGWLTDTSLANSLRAKLASVKQFMDADEGTKAKAALAKFMDLLDGSSPAQRTSEAYGLLYYNAKYLKHNMQESLEPSAVIFDLSPAKSNRPLGTTHTLTATVTLDNDPVYCWPIGLEVVSGPNAGLILPRVLPSLPGSEPPEIGLLTDVDGKSVFSYTSKVEGTDKIVAHVYSETGEPFITSKPVEVTWTKAAGRTTR